MSVDDKYDGSVVEYPMREWHVPMPLVGGFKCNPVTWSMGFFVTWGIAIWCMIDPEGSYTALTTAKAGVTTHFTWFYIVTTAINIFALLYIYIVYGKQKLGKPDDVPEFSASSYFAMIFSAGMGIGLFFYGVSEPLYDLSDSRYDTGFYSVAQINQNAMTLTLFNWGLGAWANYVLVGLTLGIAVYRWDLPLTMRTCVHPIFGDYTWGFWGDAIDAFSIIVVIAGICTSLGLGAIQMTTGLGRLTSLDVSDDDSAATIQVIVIWVVCLVATISVVSGLNVGIKILSTLALLLGCILWFLVAFLDDTAYILNVLVQSIGWYFQKAIFEINFTTDAWGQLTRGNGRGLDGDDYAGLGAYAAWMNDWTIFYWAWWTAWAAFVGPFIARISKGRTIREVLHFTFGGPLFYTFFWFSGFGGAGIRAYRGAQELQVLGELLFNDSEHYYVYSQNSSSTKISGHCYVPPSESYVITLPDNSTFEYTNDRPYISPLCTTIDSNNPWWNVMMMYDDYGYFMGWIAIVAIAIYFVTSADSGALVVDNMASNGKDEGFRMQRILWALTSGALATALILAGQSDALSALQALSIVCGLPFTCYLCSVLIGLFRFVGMEADPEKYKHYNDWTLPFAGGMFNYFEKILSLGGLFSHPGRAFMTVPDLRTHWETLRALVCPPWSVFMIMLKLNPGAKNLPVNITISVLVGGLFAGWIALFISSVAQESLTAFAWLCFFVQAFILAGIRFHVRGMYNIGGNILEDVGAGIVAYYQLLAQVLIQLDEDAIAPTDI
mmetsp:Transcript_41/g.137  ORF Transcript_41/g.137 Transcript_41/m.137 type:complete len:778 (+) Transcript_41:164-2497(+)|eukprot:CAMPEP_0171495868 /NCGR_PEP_ID=MMETSP0958-20121227/6377_1 /TAXON_ID=87120 /ORGANISM="Aurantiochytrium limacinum, Strain ATCCMYA-1381" /LENGTH=777 /DNA_ID=CAMNT_0012029891 /DNA_START=166 /DNA_END=2499 /DNA_ORIENTATION=-